MLRMFEKPLLPDTKQISLCCVSSEATDVIRYLEGRNIEVLKVEKDECLPNGLESHADLQILPIDTDTVLVNKRQITLVCALRERGVNVIEINGIAGKYPDDCKLNSLIIGQAVIGNPRCMDEYLINNYNVRSVKQGYTRCSSVLADEDTIFTDDISIYKTTNESGVIKNCGYFPQNEVILPGYDKGFIGGCCGKTGKYEIVFSGDITKLSNGSCLKESFESRGLKVLNVGDGVPYDFGGIVPLA